KLDVNAVDAKFTTAIYCAAKNGHVAAIRELASEGADVDTGIQPGHSGARLFGPNPRAKAKGSSPLWVAASRDEPEAIRTLVELGADVDKQASDGTSPFYIACKWNRLGAVKALLDPANTKLPDVNAPAGPEEYGASPLYVACDAGSEDVIEYLLANADRIRLNVDAGNQNGATPLYISWYEPGRVSQVEKLIAAGANLEARRKSGATPLLIAASYGQSEVVERLLAAGAQVNIVASDGSTPLSCAAAEGHQSVVARLLAAGADVNGGAPEKLAVREAQRGGHLGVVVDLLKAGAVAPPEEDDEEEDDGNSEDEEGEEDNEEDEGDETALCW
ncbi:ankyrin 2,3/unc44, putative, partial [Acanthamoeba castellanii str. Neff]